MVMTDGAMAGKTQKILYYTSYFVDGVESFSISVKGGTAETTHALTGQDLADKTFIGTLKEWSGSIKLRIVNFGDTNGQLAMYNAVGATTPVATLFFFDAATKATGSIIITGFDVDEPIDGVAGGTISFQGSGTLTPAAV